MIFVSEIPLTLQTGLFHMLFFWSADFSQNQKISKNSFRSTIRVSKSLDPDQAQHFGLHFISLYK